MKTLQTPLESIDLEILLEQIRLRGIAVGTMELQRLQTIFKHSPKLSRAEISDLLCTVLAKNNHQQQTIERVFQRWVPFDSALADENKADLSQAAIDNKQSSIDKYSDKDSDKKTPKRKNKRKKKSNNIALIGLITLFGIVLLALLLTYFKTEEQSENSTASASSTTRPDPTPYKHKNIKPVNSQLKLQETITIWTPQLSIRSINLWQRVLPPLALLLGAGLGFFWLLQQALKRTRKREPDDVYMHHQRIRSYLPNMQHSLPYHLLNPQERREMGWGISHYISDQPLQQLDMPRSVAESAKQGLPSLYFKQAKHERQLWLWLDRHSHNPDLLRLANEITQTLSGMNIEVQTAYFYGLPNRVNTSQNEIIWSLRHQQPEQQPLLLVLMDINSLHNLNNLQQQQEVQTFRQLSRWSHAAVVDCSNKAGQLHPIIKAHKLSCLLPQEVAHWLSKQGEGSLKKLTSVCPLDELYRWACACALPHRPISEAEIRALHEQLQLNCAWQYHNLTSYGEKNTQGFNFSSKRIALLNDLASSKDLNHAVEFWIKRHQQIDQTLLDESTSKQPWLDSRPQKQLHIDIALLQLWQKQNIEQASNTLFDLYQQNALKAEIKQKTQQLSCKGLEQGFSNTGFIYLPHIWQKLKLNIRRQLLAIGFGGHFKYLTAKWDGITATLLGLLAGLTLLGLFWTAYSLMPAPAKIITQINSKEPIDKTQKIINTTDLQSKVLVGTKKSLYIQKPIETNQIAQVYWTPSLHYAQKKLNQHSQLWLLGSKAKPKKPDNWASFSAAIIKANPANNKVQQLAAHLLDTGSVDQILISTRYNQQEELQKQWQKIPNHQIVIIKQQDIEQLLAKLQGQNSVIRYAGKKLMAQDKSIIKLANNLKLIPLPRGEFQMGSDKGESDEKPVHKVTINYDLWMSQTEVTFDQYDAYAEATGNEKPDDWNWGRKNRPVINVTLDDAQGYIEWLNKTSKEILKGLQCRLPSEAEWEYAARAGSTTNYSWGNDIGKNNANCYECGSQWDKHTTPVASFSANKFGLNDMHGNVREWVEDCYHEDYTNAPKNGSVWQKTKCSSRVMRGGSWYDGTNYLRSANRDVPDSDDRDYGVGFRVLCSLPFTEN